jgi:threonine/homoserine/homoserine lactone efflux protein
MPYDVFVALVIFASVTAFTPGPNNIMLTASGVNFGFVRSIPHLLGVGIGFILLMLACATGLGLIFSTAPALQRVLKVAGVIYMVWLAWKVARTQPASGEDDSLSRPMTFLEAVAFQWVNPKAVVVCLSAIAIYIRPGHEWFDIPVMLGVFGMTAFASASTWTGFGVALRQFLKNPLHARIFNIAMALLLVASIVPMVN